MPNLPPTGQELQREEPTRADAENWARTYARLADFTAEMLRRTYAFLEIMPGPAQRHLRNTNIRVMNEELTLFRGRVRSGSSEPINWALRTRSRKPTRLTSRRAGNSPDRNSGVE